MIASSAHFDGKVIVPEHDVDLPRDRPFVVHVETSGNADLAGESDPVHALQWLADNAVDDDLPSDLSAQHDHYLYRTPNGGQVSRRACSMIPHFGSHRSAFAINTIATNLQGRAIWRDP